MNKIDTITEIRGFNRFYTDILGLLDQYILDSGYSLTEARVIFEISKSKHCTANQLCAALDIDRSYMSRMITKFEKTGLLSRRVSQLDSRNIEISLTEKGLKEFHVLNERSNRQIEGLIEKLDSEDLKKMLDAMRKVKKYLSMATRAIEIRSYRDSDLSYVIDRQLSLYEAERHFTTETWKNYLTQGVIKMIERFDTDKDGMFILECDGNAAGCIAVTHVQEGTAQLRYFFVEPELRGLRAGSRLLNKALHFCREKKYRHAFLWTVSAQEAARSLYKSAGFEISETNENTDWGVPVLEEKWELDL